MSIIFVKKGQSILEVILAVAIFGLISAALMTLATGGFTALRQGGEQTEAEAIAQDAIEGVRSIRDDAWNNLIYTTSSINISGNKWIFSGENTTSTVGKYTRTISFENICRDASNTIATCPGSYTDIESKKVIVTVTWQTSGGAVNQVQQSTYLTNWDSREWTQTDWSGGSGQAVWSDATRYNTDDGNLNFGTNGQIGLGTNSPTTFSTTTWPFTVAGDYTYNSSKISVASDLASLADTGAGGSCSGTPNACSTFGSGGTCLAQTGCAWTLGGSGATTNPSFDSTITGWTYADWESASRVSGDRQTTGGNPNGYIRVVVAGNKNSTISGYWQQPFTTSANNPAGTVSFNWRIPTYTAAAISSFYLYVFVESTSGAPTLANYVWRSAAISGTTNWASVSNLDISSKLGAAGTYYLKVVVRGIYTGASGAGQTIGAFDNVSLNWTAADTCTGTPSACNTFSGGATCAAQAGCSWASAPAYPTDKPSIYNSASFTTTTVGAWTGFSEVANKNGGEIYYQLSNDDGATWKYWNGSIWSVVAGATDYNTAVTVNANISNFSTTSAKLMFKAFLSSNGSQLVELDQVQIGYSDNAGGGGGSYFTSGYFVSSAYNTNLTSARTQILKWDETLPSGSDLQLQVRTAPDSAGSPGAWTGWYGPSGAGTYFTNPLGAIIPAALNGNKWLQYRAELTGDGSVTPLLQEVRLNYK
ncbi:MAG: type II secretion system protein [Patescibacteria group bacterium]